MKIKFFLGMLFSIFFSSILSAQLILGGEFRPRTEFSHGQGSLAAKDQDASLFTSQRTRLNLKYKSDVFTTYLSLQDVRTWGNQRQLVGNEAASISIHEAWAELKLFENTSLKAGRQEVIYDNHRIFGSVGWAQQARSHDMAILKYEADFKVHLALAYNQSGNRKNNLYLGPDAYKALQLIWMQKSFGNFNASLMFLNNGTPFATESDSLGNVTKQTTKYSQTIGPRLSYKAGDFVFAGNFYYQAGKDKADKSLSAYELNIDGTYKATDNLTFTAGYELLSGTSYTTTSENNSFTPFYGTNHKFNGFMDYFYVGNHINSVGLSDLYFKGKYAKDKFFVFGHLHLFSAAADIAPNTSKSLGTEVDLVAGYNVSKQANIKFGYSHLFATSSMETIRGGDKGELQNWAWLMLTIKPKFLDTTPPKAE